MKLKDLKMGAKFMFANDEYLTDIYQKKEKLNKDYFLVGLPKVYDVFAVEGNVEVIADDKDKEEKK